MAYSKDGGTFAGISFTELESTFAILILASIAAIVPLFIVHRRNKTGKSDL